MTATAAMIAKVRRYVAEPDDSNGYDDDALSDVIEQYSLLDERGEEPYTFDTSTQPPTQKANGDWIATYDLHAAAAEVWEEKAAGIAHLYTFSADGGQYVRSEAHAQYMRQAAYHRARRAPRTHKMVAWPKASSAVETVGNLAEDD